MNKTRSVKAACIASLVNSIIISSFNACSASWHGMGGRISLPSNFIIISVSFYSPTIISTCISVSRSVILLNCNNKLYELVGIEN